MNGRERGEGGEERNREEMKYKEKGEKDKEKG